MGYEQWLSKRLDKKLPVQSGSKPLQKNTRDIALFLRSVEPQIGKPSADLKTAIDYFSKPDKKAELQKTFPSKILGDAFEQKLEKVLIECMKNLASVSFQDLNKKASAFDWAPIANNHAPEMADMIVHEEHGAQHPAPAELTSWLTDQSKHDIDSYDTQEDSSGYFSKIIANLPSGRVMMKPYFRAPEEVAECLASTKTSFLSGWSTMAMKNLFHSAGMGDQCEEVFHHNHKGLPVTVHKFNSSVGDYKDIEDDHDSRIANAAKITTLDYLAGNQDRHGGNFFKMPGGKFLAIDHELSFNYPVTRNIESSEHNSWAEHTRGLGTYLQNFGNREISEHKQWWKDNSGKIMDSHVKDVNLIQDPYVREHTHTNFKDRFNAISAWAKSDSDTSPWDAKTDDISSGIGLSISEAQQKKARSILKKLPEDAGVAVDTLINVDARRKRSKGENAVLHTVMEQIVNNQSAEGLARLYDKYRTKPELKVSGYSVPYFILSAISSLSKERIGSDAFEILHKRNKNGKYLPPFWAKRMRKEFGV